MLGDGHSLLFWSSSEGNHICLKDDPRRGWSLPCYLGLERASKVIGTVYMRARPYILIFKFFIGTDPEPNHLSPCLSSYRTLRWTIQSFDCSDRSWLVNATTRSGYREFSKECCEFITVIATRKYHMSDP